MKGKIESHRIYNNLVSKTDLRLILPGPRKKVININNNDIVCNLLKQKIQFKDLT